MIEWRCPNCKFQDTPDAFEVIDIGWDTICICGHCNDIIEETWTEIDDWFDDY